VDEILHFAIQPGMIRSKSSLKLRLTDMQQASSSTASSSPSSRPS
jgi:hypothetical protein